MEIIFEILFKFILEVLFQALGELPFEWLKFNRRDEPALFSFSLSAFLGIVIGITSLFIFKEHLISNTTIRLINVIIGPILIGSLIALFHEKRNYSPEKLYLFSSFWNAYVFALCVAVIRFFFIQ